LKDVSANVTRNLLIKTHTMGNIENCSTHTGQNLEDVVNMKKK
jgi:hypothetical protein